MSSLVIVVSATFGSIIQADTQTQMKALLPRLSSLKIILTTSLYLVEGLAWWDWPFTWWTDQLLSFSALTLLDMSSDP